MALAPGTRLGAYEILSPIGAGGMGEVYRARDTTLKRDVALKVLPDSFTADPDRVARFQREAEVLASLNHPHIAHIHGLQESDGVRALVLELVEGPTLADRIAQGPMPVDEALGIARQIAGALDAAHEMGIVHRDLKPANIKIRPDGTVKVLDFGLARRADAPASDLTTSPTEMVHATRAGVILGTAAYMSPEQTRGQPVDKRADVWAFGCVLFEMLTGRHAFTGQTVSDIIVAILRSEPDWSALPPATPALGRLLRRLLEKDPTRRMRDIGDVQFAIGDLLAPSDAGASNPAASWQRPWRALAIALGVLAAAGAAASFALWRRQPSSPTSATGQAIVSQLTNYDGSESAGALSPDGRAFAFVSSHGGTPDIWVRQVAGGEPVRVTNDPAVEAALAYAPNGETIYFTRTDGGDEAIWHVGALGGQARKVLNGADQPSPSPDGRRLAWFAAQAGEFGSSLVVGAADGSNRRVLVRDVATVVGGSRASWSPDGRWLAYSSGGLFAPRNLFVVNVDSGQVRQVTRFQRDSDSVATQAWLSDNRHVIVSFRTARGMLAPSDLGVLDVGTGSVVRLTMNVSDSFDAPSVSADGSRMVVTSTRDQRELWKVPFGPDPDANGLAAIRLLDPSQDPMWTYVTRDGRTLLFNNALVGSRNLWTMPLDGSAKPRQITAVAGDAVMHSSLSPDATHVAFVSSATGNPDVWVQNVDGSDLRQLTNDAAPDAWPVWSPDARWILYASLRDGKWETRRTPAAGGPAELVIEGFFRGDWARTADGTGTRAVTSRGSRGGVRLLDVEGRRIVWEGDGPRGLGLPMFSRDGRLASVTYPDGGGRDAIWVYDLSTQKGRVAVRFDRPFEIAFRASWVDDDRAFIVNRVQSLSHIVLVDNFWTPRQ